MPRHRIGLPRSSHLYWPKEAQRPMMVRLPYGVQDRVGAQEAKKSTTAIDRDEKLSHPTAGAQNRLRGRLRLDRRMREGM